MLPWSVMATAGMPNVLTCLMSGSICVAPSRRLYCVCRWRRTNWAGTVRNLREIVIGREGDVNEKRGRNPDADQAGPMARDAPLGKRAHTQPQRRLELQERICYSGPSF